MKYGKCFGILIGVMLTALLYADDFPFYLKWSSSDAISFYNFADQEEPKYVRAYKIRIGIDTLLTENVRAEAEITNQEKRLNSQVVFDHVDVRYQNPHWDVDFSLKDIGYGKGFWLYNRRADDALFEKNALMNFRWYGTEADYSLGKHKIGAGLGGNDLNQFLSVVRYSYQNDILKFDLFRFYIHRHSIMTKSAGQGGYEAFVGKNKYNFHSAFAYEMLSPTKYYKEELDDWKAINEMSVALNRDFSLIISAENRSDLNPLNADKDIKSDLYQVCFSYCHKKIQSYIGAREQHLPAGGGRAETGFLDINWLFKYKLSFGLFFDILNMTDADLNYKVGLQTRWKYK